MMNVYIVGNNLPEEVNCVEYNGKKIIYDVDRLIVDAKKKEKQVYDVNLLYSENNVVDREYAMEKVSCEPIIITRNQNEKYIILDGKHRLYKAKINGQKNIEAYFFEMDELSKYILD